MLNVCVKLRNYCLSQRSEAATRGSVQEVLKNFTKFARLRPANLLKRETLAQVFSCEFCKISKNTFSAEHHWTTAFKR